MFARQLDYETSSPVPTIASSSSASKKRKVGRPKKFMCTSGSTRHLTETIVAKKPKSKSSLVGYVLSSRNRHLQTKVSPLLFQTDRGTLKLRLTLNYTREFPVAAVHKQNRLHTVAVQIRESSALEAAIQVAKNRHGANETKNQVSETDALTQECHQFHHRGEGEAEPRRQT